MSEVVERVAKILEGSVDSPADMKSLRLIARECIAAMREPTKDMTAAAEVILDRAREVAGAQPSWSIEQAGADVYRAMIDAALAEKSDG